MGALRTSYPRFKRSGDAPPMALTADDIEILSRVFRYRFLRADDLYRLFPDRSPDRLSRRLTWLYRNQYLDRPIAQIDRFRSGGSQAFVYGLDNAGARLLAERLGLSITSGEWKARNRTYTRENLDHTLSIARFMVDLELACRRSGNVELISFDEVLADAPERTRRRPQPGRWSVPVRWADASGEVTVAPDAIFGLRLTQADGRTVRTFVFLEIDRGTMTIAPAKRVRESSAFLHRTSILRKLLTYGTSHHLQLHREHLGIPIARVLTLTTSLARAEAMRETAFNLVTRPMRLPPALFLFGALEASDDPLATAWIDAAGEPTRLTPSPP